MMYEFTSSDSDTYTYGHRLLYSDDVKYVLNAHGDVVALLNNSGVVTKRYDYDAFGNELNIDNTDTNPFRYCGEYFDTETGTIYLRARYYSPVNGRFSTVDPVRDGLNWYAYCGNNPIMFVDPLGSYYIEPVYNYCSCRDGRCKNYATHTGKYKLSSEKWWFLGLKFAVSFIKGGGALTLAVDKMIGLTGNSSSSTASTGAQLLIEGLGWKGFGEVAQKTSSNLSKVLTGVEIIQGSQIVKYDNVVFEMFEIANYEPIFDSQEEAAAKMIQMYSFVEEGEKYFFDSIHSTIGKSYFEVDMEIYKSEDPQKQINTYISAYSYYSYDSLKMRPQEEINRYREFLNNYEGRIGVICNIVTGGK